MKWKGWIGGVLLVMMLFGTLGCGKKRGPVTGGMVDGPGMMYTPEDQSPLCGDVAKQGRYGRHGGGEQRPV